MHKWLVILIFVAFMYVPTSSYGQDGDSGSNRPKIDEWQPGEMNSRMGRKIEAELKPGSWFCGFVRTCKFDLHYFFGSNYDGSEPNRQPTPNAKPLILFISGGPGDIVDREKPYLSAISDFREANVVYLDVRGTGFSVIPESNDYDQFLRAKYVVEDVEILRKTLMNECDFPGQRNCKAGVTRWDAIYASSWGTIVAQQYAATYRNNVNKLILASPVSRGQRDTGQARRKMIVDNLFDIFDKHRTGECFWDRDDPVVKHVQLIISDLDGVENFCFLNNKQKIDMKNNFAKLLNSIESQYGSVNFVTSFYNAFRNDTDFVQKYPYPKEFFDAIRELEDFGAGQQRGLLLERGPRSRKVGSAMYLAYYLWLPRDALINESHPLYPGNGDSHPECKEEAEFFSELEATEKNILKQNFCIRIRKAWDDLHFKRPSSFNNSARARSVFSVYDGLAQWIFEILKKERRVDNKGCFAGKELQNIATGDSQLQTVVVNSTVIKEQARKLGIKATDRLCPWDPARLKESGECEYCHNVDTLILKGGADAITAGEQAEYLFEKALGPGHRALIEFPGVGHLMNYQVAIEDQKPDRFDKLISDFAATVAGSKIEKDTGYKTLLDDLKRRRAVEKKNEQEKKIGPTLLINAKDLIISFVNSKTIDDFTQSEIATEAIKTLGGCLRTENKEKFLRCIEELTKISTSATFVKP